MKLVLCNVIHFDIIPKETTVGLFKQQLFWLLWISGLKFLFQIHSLSCGLKAFTTDHMMWSIETCRLACGGHGFSQASGLPKIYAHAVPACTYEGENTVMYLQCGRWVSLHKDTSKNDMTRNDTYIKAQLN